MAATTLLVIGKDKYFQDIIELYMECGANLNTIHAPSANDALLLLKTKTIDTILAPYQMPDMEGYEFLVKLKAINSKKPLIIFSGNVSLEDTLKVINNGCDFVFEKGADIALQYAELSSIFAKIVRCHQLSSELSFSEANLQTIIESTDDSIYMVDRECRYLYMNSLHRRRLGIEKDDYESKLYGSYHTEIAAVNFTHNIKKVFSSGESCVDEYEISEKYFYRKFIPVKYHDTPQVLAVIVISTEITDRKKLEENLQSTSSLLAATLESTSDGILVCDRSGKIISYNSKFFEIWSISKESVNKLHYIDFFKLIKKKILNPDLFFEKIDEMNINSDSELFIYCELEGLRSIEIFTQAQKIGLMTVGRIWSFREVTERQRATIALRFSHENYQTLVESTDDPIFMVDENCKYLFMNSHSMREINISNDGYEDHYFNEFHSMKETTRFTAAVKQVFRTSNPLNDEFISGNCCYLRKFSPVFDGSTGKVRAVTIISTDITEQKKFYAELKSNEERLRILFEFAPDGYYLSDVKGTVLDLNKALERLSGYTKDELIGKNLISIGFFGVTQVPRVAFILAKNAMGLAAGPEELSFQSKGRREIDIELMTYPVRIEGKKLVLCIARDISERKKNERVLRTSEERYRLLVDHANEGVFVIQKERIVFANPRGLEMLSEDSKFIYGRNFTNIIKQESRNKVSSLLNECETGGIIPLVTSFPILLSEQNSRWWEVKPVSFEWDHKPAALLLAMDITERKLSEDAINLAHKKLNLLSSVTRHDILNQLTALEAYILLAKEESMGAVSSEYVTKIEDISKTIRNQIQFTREYEDIGVQTPCWQNVRELIDKSLTTMNLKKIRVNTNIPGIEIFADPLLEKVFYNLIENSIRHGDTVENINISYAEQDEKLVLIYSDDGAGIPEPEKKRVFEQGVGKNTGFGLFLVREILSITGLSIIENGEPGKGVQFLITIPSGLYRIHFR